jgi:hypothetical protein
MSVMATLAILATQNKRLSREPIPNDVTHIHLVSKIQVPVSRVKSYLLMVTVVRVASPFQFQDLPVTIG